MIYIGSFIRLTLRNDWGRISRNSRALFSPEIRRTSLGKVFPRITLSVLFDSWPFFGRMERDILAVEVEVREIFSISRRGAFKIVDEL